MMKLIVLLGRPGAGKTYLSQKFIEKHSEFELVDVWSYIKPLQTKDEVPEEKIFNRYELMYQEIAEMDQDILLEIGTNYFDFNIKKLKELSNKFKVSPIFCLLDVSLCRERCLERMKDSLHVYRRKGALEERLLKIFPDNHIKLADEIKLKYYSLEMDNSLEERIKFLENL